MDNEEIRRLIELMNENDLVELEVEQEGMRVKLRRREPRVTEVQAVAVPPGAAQAPAGAPAPPEHTGVVFKSPLVGTFYRGPKPDADPFVDVGDGVNPDSVLCIVEAMKVMNEIKAEMNGTVRDILVKNGQAVQFGEPLFVIDPA